MRNVYDRKTNTYIEREETPDELKSIERKKLLEELYQIENWYKKYDYYINKIICKDWLETDERWIWYKEERKIKHTRAEEIKQFLIDN